MTWAVGSPMTVGGRLFLNDVEVTTGTVTNTYWRNNAGAVQFLQSDGSTWGASAYNWPCPYVSGTGFVNLTTDAPSSAEGYVIHYAVTHSVYGVVASGEHLVESADASSGGGGAITVALAP